MNWKSKWKKELDSVIPALDKKIIEEPVNNQNSQTSKTVSKNGRRRWYAISALATVAVMVLTFVLCFPMFLPTAESKAFAVQINPGIVFVMNEKSQITAVSSINEDGDVIVSDSSFIENTMGKSAEQATKAFVDYAIKYGFINYGDAAVKISSYDANINLQNVCGEVEAFLLSKGIPSVVFESKINKDDFARLVGTDASAGIEKAVKEMPDLFSQREIDNQSIIELKIQYESMIRTKILPTLSQIMTQLSPDDLMEILDEINNFNGEIENLINLIAGVDYELSKKVENVLSHPTTKEEFVEKLMGGYDLERENRFNQNKEDYEKDRPPIAKDDNDRHVNDIKDQHGGSLEDFWQNRNNRP